MPIKITLSFSNVENIFISSRINISSSWSIHSVWFSITIYPFYEKKKSEKTESLKGRRKLRRKMCGFSDGMKSFACIICDYDVLSWNSYETAQWTLSVAHSIEMAMVEAMAHCDGDDNDNRGLLVLIPIRAAQRANWRHTNDRLKA